METYSERLNTDISDKQPACQKMENAVSQYSNETQNTRRKHMRGDR